MKDDMNSLKTYRSIAYDNLDATKEYLEKMAREGWMLEKVSGNSQFLFVKSEPKELRFAVEIFVQGSSFDTHTIESNLEYIEYCRKAGWNFVCSTANIDIFCTEDMGATEIESDPALKLKSILKAQRAGRVFFPILFMIMAAVNYGINLTVNRNLVETSILTFSAFMLWVFVGGFYLFNFIRYLLWVLKAKKAVSEGEQIPARRSMGLKAAFLAFILFGVAYSAIVVWVGTQYGERAVWMIPGIWFVIVVLLILTRKTSVLAEASHLSRNANKVLNLVLIPCITAAVIPFIIIAAIALGGTRDEKFEKHLTPEAMAFFGDSSVYVTKEEYDEHWGHFFLSVDQYSLEAFNADRTDSQTWSFDIYHTNHTVIFERILREAKEGNDIRMLGIRFPYGKAVRMPELELEGATVWTAEETYEDGDRSYLYLVVSGQNIINARCDEVLNQEQMQVLMDAFVTK